MFAIFSTLNLPFNSAAVVIIGVEFKITDKSLAISLAPQCPPRRGIT